MATTYSTAVYAAKQPAVGGHGIVNPTARLHATSGSITFGLNDVVNVGYLPANAIVTGCALKAASQLDSNGAPTLTWDVGIVGNATLFKSAVTTVGRTVGASVDTTIAAAGYLYKTTAATLVTVTAHAAPATPVAGTVEVEVSYFVEDVTGSAP